MNALFAELLRLPAESVAEDALRLAVELGVRTIGADEGSLLVLDAEAGELVFAMTAGSGASEATLRGQRVPVGQGLTGLAALTGETQIGAPTFSSVAQPDHRADAPRFLIASPLFVGDRLFGVLTAAAFRRSEQFTVAEAELFGRVAALAAIVVSEGQRANAEAPSGPPMWEHDVALVVQRITRGDADRARILIRALEGLAELMVP
jgi:GAF domain-containing protein